MTDLDTSEHAAVAADAALGHIGVLGVQLNQDGVAFEPISDKANGSSPAEWVKDGAACGASRLDAWVHKIGRKGRKMSPSKRGSRNRPNRTPIAESRRVGLHTLPAINRATMARLGRLPQRLSISANARLATVALLRGPSVQLPWAFARIGPSRVARHAFLFDRLGVVEIPLGLGEQEKIFMRLSGPVSNAFRHGIWLLPYDVGPEPPAVRLKGESYSPRDSAKVFRFEPRLRHPVWLRHRPDGGPGVRLFCRAAARTAMAVPRIALFAATRSLTGAGHHAIDEGPLAWRFPGVGRHVAEPRHVARAELELQFLDGFLDCLAVRGGSPILRDVKLVTDDLAVFNPRVPASYHRHTADALSGQHDAGDAVVYLEGAEIVIKLRGGQNGLAGDVQVAADAFERIELGPAVD